MEIQVDSRPSPRRRVGAGVWLTVIAAAGLQAQPNAANPQAAAEAFAGKRDTANAAWWGFSAEDSTAALQGALDSGAKRVVVPYMGSPWIVTPITLRGNQEIVLDPGVVMLAKKAAFAGRQDSLFTAAGVDNLTIRGYGATLRMRKADYQQPPYEKAEWRMALALRGVKNVLIEGLRVEASGGDGFYITGHGPRAWSENVTVRNCVAENHHRQGMSVISAVNLLVENCRFATTSGTAPEAGIDLEPNHAHERLQNIVIRHSVFENNRGAGILVYLRPLSRKSAPVSIRFEHCLTRMTAAGAFPGGAGLVVGAVKEDGPSGLIEFVNCTTEDTTREAVRVYDKAASSAKVRFVNCHWRTPWRGRAPEYAGPRVPVLLHVRRPAMTGTPGGVEFVNCHVYDEVERPAIQFEAEEPSGVSDVQGVIYAVGAKSPRARLGAGGRNVTVQVVNPEASRP